MRDRQQIDDVRADKGQLIRALEDAGAEIRGSAVKCPWHEDRNASGGVHEHDGGWRYTCHGCGWNGGEGSGDVFDVLQVSRGLDFKAACEHLGIADDGAKRGATPGANVAANGRHVPASSGRKAVSERAESDSNARAEPVEKRESLPAGGRNRRGKGSDSKRAMIDAPRACESLLSDPAALAHLWNTRGIDLATAERFGVGITGEPGRRFWTFPIRDGEGRTLAVKAHRADGQDSKSFWSAPDGFGRDHIFPVHLEPSGPVFLCPGELKALAVATAGRAALGITSGEGNAKNPADLPDETLRLLRGRDVAIIPDDDDTGRAWGEHVRAQLTEAGITARIVDAGLDKSAGLKDIGDLACRMYDTGEGVEVVAVTLDDAWARSDPWHGTSVGEIWAHPRTWTPVTRIPTWLMALDDALDGGLRTRGVTLVAGKTGQAKTQLAVNVAVNAALKGTPVGYLSLELGADEVAQLAAAIRADVPRSWLALGGVHNEAAGKLRCAIERDGAIPLTILDDERWAEGLTRDGLAELVAAGVKRFGWKLIVVDYMGLLASLESDKSDYTSDVLNSAALRKLARKHDVAMLAVTALRKTPSAKYEKPEALTIDEISGAGRLVYDAQNVLLTWTKRGDDDAGLVKVRPMKRRFAADREEILSLRWHPRTGAILDLEPGDDDEHEPKPRASRNRKAKGAA
ncbi:MAG: hypothetical protein EDS66_12225 [Planctomycetota bacterium]|nr:MAG: hypothetical protein EDS66_12225 [Planctomycetota bacterium]